MCQTSVNLTPCCIKHTSKLETSGPIISLNKIRHQMWCNHTFSQRKKTAERAVGMGAGGDRERWGGLDSIWGDRQYRGGLHEIRRGVRSSLATTSIVLRRSRKEIFYNLSNLSLIGSFWSLTFFQVLLQN